MPTITDATFDLVGHQALVPDVHREVVPDVLAARVVEGLAGRPTPLRGAIGQEVPIAAARRSEMSHPGCGGLRAVQAN